MRVISVASAKGGVGKTTLVSNLGVTLASDFDRKVLIVDCNITTSHLGLYLGMDNFPVTLNHVLKGSAEIGDAVYRHASGLSIMPASISLSDMAGVDVFELPAMIEKILREYQGRIDYLLLDCAPGLGREAMAALRASREIVFVTTPYLPSVIDVVRCRQVIEDLRLRHLGSVLNMVRGSRAELSAKDVERVTNMPVLASIPMDDNVLKGLAYGMPVTMSKARSRSSRSMKGLAEVIMSRGGL